MLKTNRTIVGQTLYKRKYTYIYTSNNVVIMYFNVYFMIIIFIYRLELF